MNSRLFIVISLALNVALGALVVRWATTPAAPAAVPRIPRLAPVTTAPIAPAAETNAPLAPPPSVDAAFHWSELAADDLKVYRDNLRAVGCPEATVRDIILAEINERFRQKRKTLLADAQQRFWSVAARGEKALETEWEEPLKKLDEERTQLIAAVLGEDHEDEQNARTSQTKRLEREYAWLPEDKRAQLVALGVRYQQQVDDYWKVIREHGPDYRPTEAESQRIGQMQKAFEAARKELLGPEASAEFQLRASNTANWAAQLDGFDVTEAEWRAVGRLRLQYDEALKSVPEHEMTLEDPERQRAAARTRNELHDALESTIHSTLGDARYEEYQLARNHDLQQTRRITERYGLPESVARETYQVQRAAAAEADQVRKSPDLSAEARLAQLAAIRKETERTLAETLGGKVFSTYQEYHGDWLNQLGQLPEE
jgi:hypothetical protein